MAKIDMLAEQTAFLLEKQKEALSFFKDGFEALHLFIKTEQEKSEKVKAGSDLESFTNVIEMIGTQEEETIDQCEEDLAFLEEQLVAIKQVQNMSDEEKAKELTSMMLGEDAGLIETSKFKVDVEQEAEESKQGFTMMVDDIKSVLLDDGVKELETLLEVHMNEEQSEEDDEDECDEEEASCETSCDSCDIFKGLEEKIQEENDSSDDEDEK